MIIEDGENLHWQPPRRGSGKMHVEKHHFGQNTNILCQIYCFDKISMKVGNDEVRPLFEAFGTVTECEVIKNYGSVSHSSFCASITLKNYFVC